ncbi:MAG: hypothetical protein U0353_20650 [Sandaracinus sp.]
MGVHGTAAELVFAVPRLAPRWVRVSTVDGSMIAAPTALAEDAPLVRSESAPITHRLRATRRRLTLERRDLRGARVGADLAIAPASGRVISASAWDGTALEVVWATRAGREWVISESRVSCMP